MEGLYRESVAADGDGDLPEAVQEQHLAAVLHGLFGACARGHISFFPVAGVLLVLSVGSVIRGEKSTGKLVAFRAGSGYLCSRKWGIGSVLVAVECGMACGPWTFSGY